MIKASQAEPSYAVLSLLGYLEKEYYVPVERVCDEINSTLSVLRERKHMVLSGDFTVGSTVLVEQVTRYVRLRRLSLVPYLNELAEKEDSGHDCRQCATSCTIRHAAQLDDIRSAHDRIKTTIKDLQIMEAATPPAPGDTPEGDLRHSITVLEDLLSELLYLEDTALIPKITEVQKAIHAHD